MKKFTTLFAMFVMMCFIAMPVTAHAYTAGKYKTTTDNLNFRAGAGTSYKSLAKIPLGTVLSVTKVDGSWGKTTYKGNAGWIYLEYTKKVIDKNDNTWYKSGDYWYFHNTERDVTFKSNNMHTANLKIAGLSSGSNYYIVIDNKKCQTYVFKKKNGEWIPYKAMNCCVGASSTPTVKGTFTISARGYSFDGDNYSCYYWVKFYGNYLFHSVLYKKGTKTLLNGTVGQAISHGCVRLKLDEAKWVYDTIPNNTKVLSY